MLKSISFLILHDDEDSRFLLRRRFESSFPRCFCVEVTDPEAALRAMAYARFDAVLTDHHLRGSKGVSFVADARRSGVTIPLVMVTNSVDPAMRSAAMLAGANEVFDPQAPELISFLQKLAAQ